ncbi:hypothetical protein C2G38_1959338 [Gigaspora rosea]|uniref:Zinc finger CHCC-type domain-containing protein n=1 Tax=Gigaspora rosea TaxID=44941 RepID=A0A397VNI7_9GLOM|nr:hypothetical protein C2G38_1959338 [Gigaspora rosea]
MTSITKVRPLSGFPHLLKFRQQFLSAEVSPFKRGFVFHQGLLSSPGVLPFFRNFILQGFAISRIKTIVTWSPSQRSKKDAMVGPRFEQTDLEVQPNTAAAIELIAEEPIHYVEGRIAVCHGGGGPLGHPQIYINLDRPGSHACGYCTF